MTDTPNQMPTAIGVTPLYVLSIEEKQKKANEINDQITNLQDQIDNVPQGVCKDTIRICKKSLEDRIGILKNRLKLLGLDEPEGEEVG